MKSLQEIKNNMTKWVKNHPTESLVIGVATATVGYITVDTIVNKHRISAPATFKIESMDIVPSKTSSPVRTMIDGRCLNTPTLNDLYYNGNDWSDIMTEISKAVTNSARRVGLDKLDVTDVDVFECASIDTGLTDIILNNVTLDDLGKVGEALRGSGCFDPAYHISMSLNETLNKVM